MADYTQPDPIDVGAFSPGDFLGKVGKPVPNNKDDAEKQAAKTDELTSAIEELEGGFELSVKKLSELLRLLKKQMEQMKKSIEATKDLTEEEKSAAGGGGGGGGKPKGEAKAAGGGKGKQQGQALGDEFKNGFTSGFNIGPMLAAGALAFAKITIPFTKDIISVQSVFKGVVQDEMEFMVQMREIGYVTQGITGDFADAQEAFQKIGKTVAITGVDLTTFQQSYVKNLQRGIKTQKEMVSVTKTGLHVSTMVGDVDNQIADTLATWHMHMGLTAGQTAQLGRGIQSVAKETGVMGSSLANVVKQSEGLIETMRNVGTLTASSAANMIRLMASAEKLGVGPQMKELAEGASSVYNFFNNTDGKMKNLLIMISDATGRLNDMPGGLFSGSFATGRSGQRDIARGLEDTVQRLIGVSLEATDAVDQWQNLAIQNITGKSFGELKRMQSAAADGAKPFAKKVEEITKSLNDQNATEKQALLLKKQLLDLELSRGFEFVSKFQESADKSNDMNEALSKYSAAMSKDVDMMEDLKGAGIDTADAVTMATQSMEYGAKKLKDAGGKDFSVQISKAIGSKDLKGIKTVMEQMSEEQQKLGMEEKKKADPFSEATQKLFEINERLRDFFGGSVRRWSGFLVKMMIATKFLAELLFASQGVAFLFKSVPGMLGSLKEGIKSVGAGLVGFGRRIMGRTAKEAVGGMASAATESVVSTVAGKATDVGLGAAAAKMLPGAGEVVVGAGTAATTAATTTAMAGMEATTAALGTTTAVVGAEAATTSGALAGLGTTTAIVGAEATATAAEAAALGSTVTVVGAEAAATAAEAAALGSTVTVVGAEAATTGGVLAGFGATIAAIAWPVLIAVAVIASVVGVIIAATQGFRSFNKAAEIFNKKQEQLSMHEKLSAGAAGVLTGALNVLTFGVFSDWLGATGKLTVALAHLIKIFGYFTLVMLVFEVLLGALVGVYRFVKNVFIGIWDGIVAVVTPVIDVLKEIYDIFADALSPILDAFTTKGGEAVGVFETIANVLGFIGEVIGGLFRAIGKIVGFLIKTVLRPVVWIVKIIAAVIKVIASIIAPVIKAVIGFFGDIYDLTMALLNFDFPSVGKILYKMFVAPFVNVGKWLWDHSFGYFTNAGEWLWEKISAPFAGFGGWLYDHSIGALVNMMPGWLKKWLGIEEKPKTEAAVTTAATEAAAPKFDTTEFDATLSVAENRKKYRDYNNIDYGRTFRQEKGPSGEPRLVRIEPTDMAKLKAVGAAGGEAPPAVGIIGKTFEVLGKAVDILLIPLRALMKIIGALGTFIWNTLLLPIRMFWTALSSLFSILGKLVTLDFSGAWAEIKAYPSMIARMIWDAIVGIPVMIWNVLTAVPGMILEAFGIENVFTKIKDSFVAGMGALFGGVWQGIEDGFNAIFSGIWGGIQDFASGIWEGVKAIFAPIGEVFVELWETAKGIFTDIGGVFTDLWDTIKAIFEPITSLFSSAAGEGGGFISAMQTIGSVIGSVAKFIGTVVGAIFKTIGWILGTAAKVIGHIIGFVLKLILFPLRMLIKIVGFLVKLLLFPVKLIIKAIGWLAKLIWHPIRTIMGAFTAIGDGFTAIGDGLGWVWDVIKSAFSKIGDGLGWAWKIISWPFRKIADGLMWVWDNVVKPVWDTIVSALTWAKDVLTTGFQAIVAALEKAEDWLLDKIGQKENKYAKKAAEKTERMATASGEANSAIIEEQGKAAKAASVNPEEKAKNVKDFEERLAYQKQHLEGQKGNLERIGKDDSWFTKMWNSSSIAADRKASEAAIAAAEKEVAATQKQLDELKAVQVAPATTTAATAATKAAAPEVSAAATTAATAATKAVVDQAAPEVLDKYLGQKQGQEFSNQDYLDVGVGPMAKVPSLMKQTGGTAPVPEQADAAAAAQVEMAKQATTKGSLFVHDFVLEQLLKDMLVNQSAAVQSANDMADGRMPIPKFENNVPVGAPPVGDVYDRIRQEQSAAQSAVGESVQTTKLESLNEEQLKHLIEINENIATLVGLMKPSTIISTGPGNATSSRSHMSPAKSTDYARWQFGLQSGNPSTGEINTGAT